MLPKPPLTGDDQYGCGDTRPPEKVAESSAPAKEIKFPKQSPSVGKLARIANKIAGSKLGAALKSKAISTLKSKALPLASKAALGPIGGAIAAKIAGKYATPLLGKLAGNLSSVTKAAGAASGAITVVRETNLNKLRRPLVEGLSASASAAAKPLGETVAKSILSSLVSGKSLSDGLGSSIGTFKTAAALVKSPRFFNPKQRAFTVDPKDKEIAEKAVRHVEISNSEARLYPQAGLLEDEIMYRLVLLAENVYAPTRAYAERRGWGAPEILDGFRAENSTTSPHERGEALDITLGDATRCFELAQWMRDHILYDQLILCHDISNGGQTWIHVSFTVDNRRRQVLTKTFNDTFVDGLHIYERSSGTDTATEQNVQEGDKFITMLAERQQRLSPVNADTQTPQQQAGLGSSGGEGEECGKPDPSVPNELGTVLRIYGDGSQWDLTTNEGGGLFVEAVVAALPAEWGHIKKSGGQTQAFGHAVDAIMYLSPTPLYNGQKAQAVDIIASHGAPEAAPAWQPVCEPDDGSRFGGK